MRNNLKRYILLLIPIIMLLVIYLNVKIQPAELHITRQNVSRINIPRIASSGPLDIDSRLDSVNFIFLEEKPCSMIRQNDQMAIAGHRILILSKGQHKLFIFSTDGKFVSSIHTGYLDNFEVSGGSIDVYNRKEGKICRFDLDGKIKFVLPVGFHGIGNGRVTDSLYAFYTAGANQRAMKRTPFELVLADRRGTLRSVAFLTAQNKWKTKYYPSKRFCSTAAGLYFIPAFANVVYQINPRYARAVYELNFFEYTLTAGACETVNKVDDYHMFPYVFDISMAWESGNYCFFNFSFKGEEGYLLYNKASRKSTYGLGYLAGANSDFNVAIPEAAFDGRLYCAIPPSAFNSNHENFKPIPGVSRHHHNARFTANPVIISYRLRGNGMK